MAKKGVHATRNMGAGIAKGFGTMPTGNVTAGGFGGGGGYASNDRAEMTKLYDPGAKAAGMKRKSSTMGDSTRTMYSQKEITSVQVKHPMATANQTKGKKGSGKGSSGMGKITAGKQS